MVLICICILLILYFVGGKTTPNTDLKNYTEQNYS